MTRKFKYHASLDQWEELPRFPDPQMITDFGTYVAWYGNAFANEARNEYRAHLSTLRDGKHNPMIPGSPECREQFEDGQVCEVGTDIEIYTDIPKGWMPSYINPPDDAPIITVVVPIARKTEDDVWNEALCFYFNQRTNGVAEAQIVKNLTKKYSITRK